MSKPGKSMKMKNPPHPSFSVRVDCLEPHGLSVTEGAKVLGVSRSALALERASVVRDEALHGKRRNGRMEKGMGEPPEGG